MYFILNLSALKHTDNNPTTNSTKFLIYFITAKRLFASLTYKNEKKKKNKTIRSTTPNKFANTKQYTSFLLF